jgi:hypothetical protein
MEPNNNLKTQLNNRKQSLINYAKYSAFAFQMIGIFVALSLGGNWVDKHWNLTFPYFTLLGVLLSLISIFYTLYVLINKNNEA